MKKIIFPFAPLALLVFLALAPVAQAKDLSKLQVSFSSNINKDCSQADGYDAVWGCYNPILTKGAESDTIFIRKDLPAGLLPYVFYYNLGQYLMLNVSDQELQAAMNPAPDLASERGVRVLAGNNFVMWAMGGHINSAMSQLFAKILTQ